MSLSAMFRSAALALLVAPVAVMADPRPFTFTNDAYSMGEGEWEYEQWVTYEGDTESNKNFQRLSLRHEFEFGLADNFDLAIYFPEWRVEKGEDDWESRFRGGAVEGVFYLTNPVTDPVGIGLYNETKIFEDELEFEQKLILHKDIDNWILAYNLVLETELEHVFDKDEDTEVEGVIKHTFGVGYAVAPDWIVGTEAVVSSSYADWSDYEETTVYAGPSISYQGGNLGMGDDSGWWATFTPTFQLTDEDAPHFNFRLIFGLYF